MGLRDVVRVWNKTNEKEKDLIRDIVFDKIVNFHGSDVELEEILSKAKNLKEE